MGIKAAKTDEFTETFVCGHCGNTSAMTLLGTYDEIENVLNEEHNAAWDEGPIWELSKCPSCKRITLREGHYFEPREEDGVRYAVVYPTSRRSAENLPPDISKACDAANRIRHIDANAYAVLIGRVLDKVCMDKNATGESLYDRLSFLAEQGTIPDQLATMAHKLRKLRNIGAHADLGDLTEEEIPILSDLCWAILEYVYTGPALIKKVESKLAAVGKRGARARPSKKGKVKAA